MKRLHFIDQLRAISIFLIVYGHNDYTTVFSDFLSNFRLPLFFILSGFLAREKRAMPLKTGLIKYARQLMVPYFLTAIILFAFWLLVGRHYGQSAEQDFSAVKNLIGIFYAQGGAEFMDWGIPLWFLPALFCVIMIDFLVARLKNPFRLILLVALPFAGFYAYRWLGYHLPWSLDVAMVVYLYYYLGKELRKRNFLELIETKELIFVAIPFLIHLGIFQFVPTPTFYYGEYGILPLTYLTGALGFIWLFSLMKLLPTWYPVVWIGQNTLPILTFHLLAMTFIKAIALFVFNMEITFNVVTSLGFALLQILILVPFIILMNRHLPFLVGKWTPKKDSSTYPGKG